MQLSMQRVVEAVVIGGVLALIGYGTIIPRLEERMNLIRDDISDLKREIRRVDAKRETDYRELSERMVRIR